MNCVTNGTNGLYTFGRSTVHRTMVIEFTISINMYNNEYENETKTI